MAEKTKDELRKIASTMRGEYKSNKNLTVLKEIEHEDFVEWSKAKYGWSILILL